MKQKHYAIAYALALITIGYNLVEGLVSVWLGYEGGALTLFGFGLDSFVEVVSGIGVWHMVRRQRLAGESGNDAFERQALRVTGSAFYLLAAGLLLTVSVNVYQGRKPETTFWGMVVGAASIASMCLLIHYKVKVGRELGSDAIIADAACTRTCLHLSAVLLAASIGYWLTGIGYIDFAGTALIAWLSIREGREAFYKAAGHACCCGNRCPTPGT